MDEKRYEETVENASRQLVEDLLDRGVDGLIEEGRQLDSFVDDMLREVGQRMMRQLYATLGAALEKQAKFEGMTVQRRKSVDFSTVFGPIEVDSPYLYDRETGNSARPLKDQFGVRGDGISDAVDRALSEFGKETSFKRAAQRFEEHYGWEVGRTTVLRRTETVGEAAEQFVAERLETGKERLDKSPRQRAPGADELITEADGCHIRTGRKMTAGEAREETDNPEELQRLEDRDADEVVRLQEWKEVRTGLVHRPGEDDATYVCQRGEWSEVIGELFGAACLHGWEFDTQVVAVADGAHGLKEAFEEWFAHLQFILDKPHLRDHFLETAEQLAEAPQGTELVEQLDDWVEQMLARLDKGEVQSVIGDLTTLSGRLHDSEATERLDRLIAHLTRFCHCVDYDNYKAKDWPVGSGKVESAHKHVPQHRLKQPGACWREENLNPMCALRVLDANDWWDEFWAAETNRRAA